jgi:hypothetical protein
VGRGAITGDEWLEYLKKYEEMFPGHPWVVSAIKILDHNKSARLYPIYAGESLGATQERPRSDISAVFTALRRGSSSYGRFDGTRSLIMTLFTIIRVKFGSIGITLDQRQSPRKIDKLPGTRL